MEAPEGLALLIWHSEDVTWDEGKRSITFTSIKPSATPITIKDGDIYQFGGISDQGLTSGLTLLAPPDEMCQGTRLIVDFVEFVDYGPLAIVAPSDSRSLVGGLQGPIRIGDNCVIVDGGENDAVLVFHAEDVVWLEEDRSITYRSIKPSPTPITMRDGDIFQFGGIADLHEGLDFIASPRPECPATRLIVDFVEFPRPEP